MSSRQFLINGWLRYVLDSYDTARLLLDLMIWWHGGTTGWQKQSVVNTLEKAGYGLLRLYFNSDCARRRCVVVCGGIYPH